MLNIAMQRFFKCPPKKKYTSFYKNAKIEDVVSFLEKIIQQLICLIIIAFLNRKYPQHQQQKTIECPLDIAPFLHYATAGVYT